MRRLRQDQSLDNYVDQLLFLEAALDANDETRSLAAPVTMILNEFADTREREFETRRGVVRARAHASVADAMLDEAIRDVHANTLHEVRQDRSDPVFATLFQGSIAQTVRYALKRQLVVAKDILEKLALSLYSDAFRATQNEALNPPIARGDAVLEEQRAAELTRTEARLEIQAWKEDVNAVCLTVYSELLALTARTRRKRTWADTFFPKDNSPRTRPASEDNDA